MGRRERLQAQLEEPALKRLETSSESEAQHTPPNTSAQAILNMQRTHGNKAVQRMLSRVQRSSLMEGGPLSSEISEEINSKRGSGASLDSNVASSMSAQMGHDFSDVSVHTDVQADRLNKDLGAKAFTTGKDIFFSEGAYQPNSDDGQKLLAHELTHVVHQDGSNPSGDLTLGPANDSYEQHADSVASSVGTAGVQAKMDSAVQRDDMMEEEDAPLQTMRDPNIQREAQMEEEDPDMQLMRDPDVQRQEEEEDLV